MWCVVLSEFHVCYPLHEQELSIITHTFKPFLRLAISVPTIISAKILDTNPNVYQDFLVGIIISHHENICLVYTNVHDYMCVYILLL